MTCDVCGRPHVTIRQHPNPNIGKHGKIYLCDEHELPFITRDKNKISEVLLMICSKYKDLEMWVKLEENVLENGVETYYQQEEPSFLNEKTKSTDELKIIKDELDNMFET
jgi:hypothetical protein